MINLSNSPPSSNEQAQQILSNISQEKLLQIVSMVLAQRSRFYAQVIVADIQNLSSLKTTLNQNTNPKFAENLSSIPINNNSPKPNIPISPPNGNGNGNPQNNYRPEITKPSAISPSVSQQNQVTSKPKTLNIEEILIDLVVQQTGYPEDSITPDLKLLDDLNLDSIKAGELIANAAKECGVAGEIEPSSLANATLQDVAEAIRSEMPTIEAPEPIKSKSVSKVASKVQTVDKTTSSLNSDWVRNFAVEYVTNWR